MNKFAPIAFILLLLCGAGLWFLASDSLNFHIKNQIQMLGSKLSQQNVRVENVTIRSYQGSGTISNLTIAPLVSKDPSKAETLIHPTLSIASIDLSIDRESLKKEIVIIDSLTIRGLTASISPKDTGVNFEETLATVRRNIQLQANSKGNIDHVKLQKISPPNLKITKVIIESALIQIVDNNNQVLTVKVLPKIEWLNIGTEDGLSGEEIGIEIFEQLLIELTGHSKRLQTE